MKISRAIVPRKEVTKAMLEEQANLIDPGADLSAEESTTPLPFMLEHKVSYPGAVSFTTTGTYDNIDGGDNT